MIGAVQVSATAALPLSFLDWWFAPWRYAPRALAKPYCHSLLAQRDTYRSWCTDVEVRADLPINYDDRWCAAALTDSQELLHCASLFGGLFAARQHHKMILKQLSFESRRWCMSIVLTQPLKVLMPSAMDDLSIENYGLLELALRLESYFPGMWSRLKLLLDENQVHAINGMLATLNIAFSDAAHLRSQRCWNMCLQQVRSGFTR